MARVCGQCGAGTEPGVDFCGQCGAYLEWDEPAAETREAPPAEVPAEPDVPSGEPEEPAPGLTERLKAAIGITPAPDESSEPTSHDVVPPTAADPQPVTAAVSSSPSEDATPVQPAVPAPRPRALAPPPSPEQIGAGDLICGECGTGNKPERKFCRRCGHPLVDAEVARVPWWRRLARRLRRPGLAAGARPRVRRRRRLPRRLAGLAVVLGVLAAGVSMVRPHAGEWRGVVLDRVKGVEEVNPQRVTSSPHRPGHPPSLASDTRSNTWWSPKGPGAGAALTFQLDPPVRLVYVSIAPGVTVKDKKLLRTAGRPRTVKLTLIVRDPDTGVTRQTARTLTLQNRAGLQTKQVATSDVVAASLQILSIYPGTNPRQGVAVGEVEFRARK